MNQVVISELMETSGVKFGTSGARGLVVHMTDRVCYAYTLAFLNYLEDKALIQKGADVAVAGDYRFSTPRIMKAVGLAIQAAGFRPVSCGFVPTPAVALYSLQQGIASIMVTGSHIPDDRNGIKFYKPEGEILKADELGMCARTVVISPSSFDEQGFMTNDFSWAEETSDAHQNFVSRYIDFFPADCLKGKRIGVYEHSSVARNVLTEVMQGLGADVIKLGFSKAFIPVDTEAVREEDIALAKQWSAEYSLDCVVSADGDGDRPLVSDEFGNWLRGDVAGIVCAAYLQADAVATPVSCNNAVEKFKKFQEVKRTRIGSPFVIEAMNKLLAQGFKQVVGYEANGGFLTASAIKMESKVLAALPTRDAVIVPLTILLAAIQNNSTISVLFQTLPQRFTSSGRLQNFPTELSQQKIAALRENAQMFEQTFGEVINMDETDGFRITFASDEVVHLRPSGNAPELRCYTEASSEQRANEMVNQCMDMLQTWKTICFCGSIHSILHQ